MPRRSISRRRFLQGVAAGSSALVFAPLRRRAGAAALGPADGFLTADEYRLVEALTARIVSSDDGTPGARECGVADYVQGLLSAFPGADANGDGRASAADLTAVALAAGARHAGADVNGDGRVDEGDRSATVTSIFGGPALAGPPAFAGRPIFAGGPFSGRHPYPDAATGTASDEFPLNAFRDAVPLTRVQRLAWTARLLGADAVAELRDNPLARSLPDVDLRRRYRTGLADVDAFSREAFDTAFDALGTDQQDAVVTRLRRERRPFHQLLLNHVVEGMLSAPEYGGNRDLAGWRLVGFDGDSQPLGYTIYDADLDDYRERPDKPNSTIDPGDACSGFSDEMTRFLRVLLVQLAGATEFDEPFCFPG